MAVIPGVNVIAFTHEVRALPVARLRCPAQALEGFFLLDCISDFPKLFLTLDPNHLLIPAIPSRERGRWPSSLTLGRGAVDADALLTNSA